ncbi:four-carbon acid sugar kinase family protein [Planococcus maritimus]|uniref:four-carbon acid sugar kinase family protein n=1 Tax=Planococcus maritimus TaxID=192421 RepID=UPI0031399763
MAGKIGIIADDFTGANDSGVRLAQKGLRSKVMLSTPAHSPGEQAEIDVWIADTNSRSTASDQAYENVCLEIENLKKRGVTTFYKKIDSTLRGNIKAELQALQKGAALDVLLIAPAFPSMGRTVEDGHLYVYGQPVTETEFARDPKTPVRFDYIPELLEGMDDTVAVLDHVRLRGESPERWITEQVGQGVRWIVCDTVVEQDLAILASLEAKLDLSIGFAGSAGLINHLYTSAAGVVEQPAESVERVLVVSGSLSKNTQSQITKLSERQATCMIEIDPMTLLEDPVAAKSMLAKLDQVSGWDSAVIFVGASEYNRDQVKAWAKQQGETAETAATVIAQGLGSLVNAAMEKVPFDAVVMTGGDTAKAICGRLGIADMELKVEVEAGLPLGVAKWQGKDISVITKAGGFGNEHSLVHVVDYLKGAKSDDDQ